MFKPWPNKPNALIRRANTQPQGGGPPPVKKERQKNMKTFYTTNVSFMKSAVSKYMTK